jgi:hypothetical protein
MRLFMGVLAFTILPLAAFAEEGRYQGIPALIMGEVFIVDTKTGEVKLCRWNIYDSTMKCSPYSK